MSQAVRRSALVAVSAAALTLALTGSASAGPNLTNLPESATSFQKAFQPYFDYDSDGCFPATAIDMWGNLNGGLKPTGSLGGGCRTDHLGNANTYSRAKCNNGWCGIIYALYFEKDQADPSGSGIGGHRGGHANFPIQDSKFNDTLNKAKPSGIPFNPYGAG
ncbi:NPP1 family protein [Streptomyces sp. Ag109_G2-15]|uniref:NPP1 family protein n=1 Tax=Streptomyces sp. Ag109_G2-15 TaxID=1938850 RepID=UPI000BC4A627|nr:NPP1 family protein [Streptomyces sp. Ag109_G2-15]SOD85078.1 Necrosis inducing protein (NPP1) [Streptomyces sp. Ag109_G2-15]